MLLLRHPARSLLLSLGLLVPARAQETPRTQEAAAQPAAAAPLPLDEVLEPLRARYELPALGGAVVLHGELFALGAVGRRRIDGPTPVTAGDRWHLGSCTKSMTATWIALHVQRGDLAWRRTLGESFPELFESGKADPAWHDVTLELLLQNRGGAPESLDEGGLWKRLWERHGTPAEQRMELVRGVLSRPPVAPPGTKFVYSNAGFSIAAAAAERALGVTWEDAITRELFAPLGMDEVGFGEPGEAGKVVQPFGHATREGELRPTELGPYDDNPSAIAPAGKVAASLSAWARYAALHLAGARGEPNALGLEPGTFAVLHAPHQGDYAMGWVVRQMPWAKGRVLWHNGSNTLWYCEIAIVPDEDMALLVTSNRGDGRVRDGVGETLRALHAWGKDAAAK